MSKRKSAALSDNTTFRKWFFTWNINDANPGPPQFDPERMSYMIYQTEAAPSTGQLHYQGFVVLKSPTKMLGVKKLLKNEQIHLKKCYNQEGAIEYCKKAESRVPGTMPVEYGGSPPSQGKRQTLHAACDAIKAGAKLGQVAFDFPDVIAKHGNGIRALIGILSVPTVVERKVFAIGGEPGIGKSHIVNECFPAGTVYTVFQPTAPWFDGFMPGVHRVVLFDDYFKKGRMPLDYMKKVTDKWPLNVPIKGGSVEWTPEIVIFTSNEPVDTWYEDVEHMHQVAIRRRITKEWWVLSRESEQMDEIRSTFKAIVDGWYVPQQSMTGSAGSAEPAYARETVEVVDLVGSTGQYVFTPLASPPPLRRQPRVPPSLPPHSGRVLFPVGYDVPDPVPSLTSSGFPEDGIQGEIPRPDPDS